MDRSGKLAWILEIPYAPEAVAIITVVTLFYKMIAPLFKALEFHDKHLVRKKLERLKTVKPSVSKNPELASFIDDSIHLEAFRIATRVNTSKAKMEYLLKIASDGLWSHQQIRSVSKFLFADPGQLTPSIRFSWADKVGSVLGISTAISIIAIGLIFLAQFIIKGGGVNYFLGFLNLALCVLVSRFFANDFIDYKVAKRIEEHLEITNKEAS